MTNVHAGGERMNTDTMDHQNKQDRLAAYKRRWDIKTRELKGTRGNKRKALKEEMERIDAFLSQHEPKCPHCDAKMLVMTRMAVRLHAGQPVEWDEEIVHHYPYCPDWEVGRKNA